jgi:hypothetical protein
MLETITMTTEDWETFERTFPKAATMLLSKSLTHELQTMETFAHKTPYQTERIATLKALLATA